MLPEMSRVLLMLVSSSLHNPKSIENVSATYVRSLRGIVDSVSPLITTERELEKISLDDNTLAVVAPLTGGIEHIICSILERVGFVLLIPHTLMNSLPAALESFSKFRSCSKAWIILEWPPGRKIKKFIKSWRAMDEIRKMKIGLIGDPSPWLIYSSGPLVEENLTKIFNGLKIIRINLNLLNKELEEGLESKMSDLSKEILGKAKASRISNEELYKSLAIYSAMERLLNKYALDAVSVRCFDIVRDAGTTACLAVSLLNKVKAVAGCEGDLPALITMIISSKLANAPSFMANLIWAEKDKLTFAHCTVPLTMVEKFELDTHYESGIGVGIRGYFTGGRKVTIVRLDPISKVMRYSIGKIIRGAPMRKELCRTNLTIRLEPNRSENISQYISDAVGNHYVIALRDISEEIVYASRILGVRPERI